MSWIVAVVLVIFPLVYLVSFGPVQVYYQKKGEHISPALDAFYSPAVWITRHTWLDGPMHEYLHWCEETMFGPIDVE